MDPIAVMILVILSYVAGMPILLRLIAFAQKKFFVDRKLANMPKGKAASANLPKPIWGTWRERLKFTRKDDREAKLFGTRKRLYFGLLIIGLIVTVVAAVLKLYLLLPVAYILYFVATFYAIGSAKDVLETRKKIMVKMYQIAANRGVVDNGLIDQPEAVIEVLEWRDHIKPKKAKIQMRTEFDAAGCQRFLELWNQNFGQETAWVPSDDPETGTPGWNFAESIVTIHEVPPLPQMAPWDEHYVLDPAIAWSFFPLALGVENGVELTNPKTGEVENVLGFDLSGEQAKVGKKAGVKVSEKIVTSPMVLCSGGTGGGKSLSINTLIQRVKQ